MLSTRATLNKDSGVFVLYIDLCLISNETCNIERFTTCRHFWSKRVVTTGRSVLLYKGLVPLHVKLFTKIKIKLLQSTYNRESLFTIQIS